MSEKDVLTSNNLNRLIPNALTLASLAFGLTSVKYGLAGKFEQAIFCIMLAMFLDGIDGRIARFIGATSEFGAQLDSLCDLVNFGVAPALVVYTWINPTNAPSPFLWSLTLLYVMCMAIRLARFNVLNDSKTVDSSTDYFIGIPAPAGAFLALLPIMLSFDFQIDIEKKWWIFYLATVGLLLASRIPTISLKKVKIAGSYLWLIMVIFGMIVSFIIIEPWIVLPILALIYLIQMPFFAYKIKREPTDLEYHVDIE